MEVVKFRDYKRWGEPLADGISRVLGGVYLTDWELWSTLLFPIVEEITVSLRFPYLFLHLRRHFPIRSLIGSNIEVKTKDGLIIRECFKSQVLIEDTEVVSEIRALSMCLDQLSGRLCDIINSSTQ